MSFRMTDDTRVQCVRCGNYRQCRCFEPIKAEISVNRRPLELARDFAEQPQHCPAYVQSARQNLDAAQKNTKSA